MSETADTSPQAGDRPADVPTSTAPGGDGPSSRTAEAMLLLVTVVWGSSFALAKEAGAAVNAAAEAPGSPLGPILILGLRFSVGAVIVGIVMYLVARTRRASDEASHFHVGLRPRCKSEALTHDARARDDAAMQSEAGARPARAGMSVPLTRGDVLLGGLLVAGTVLQHLALDRTSEAATAFLTSLTVIFVPLLLWIALRRPPGAAAWAGVGVAVPGVWLMSGGASAFGVGLGEALGLACAVIFAGHLLAVGRYGATLGALRACLAQFAGVAIVCVPLSLLLIARLAHFDADVLATRAVWGNVLLLVAGPTLVSFGLMAAYQPRVAPVRAALIYLLEPIFAAMFAWLWTGRAMTPGEWAGGALILAANTIVEAWPRKGVRSS